MWGTTAGNVWKWCGQFLLPAWEFPEFSEFLDATGFPVTSFSWSLHDSDSGKSHDFWILSVAAGFRATSTINPPRHASFSCPWELDAASGFEFLLALASGFPLDVLSTPGLFDAIGWFTDEELVETVDVRFFAVGFDFATILSSSFRSCTLFAIVLVQLVNLKFWAQQRELKWLMLNKWRRWFHSSRVELPLVKMSASWCVVSMYLIWLLGSWLIPSNNQSGPTLWVPDTFLIVGLLLLIIILITASLSWTPYNIAPNREGVTWDETWSTLLRLSCWVGLWFFMWSVVFRDRFLSLWLLIFGFVDLVWWGNKYFNH